MKSNIFIRLLVVLPWKLTCVLNCHTFMLSKTYTNNSWTFSSLLIWRWGGKLNIEGIAFQIQRLVRNSQSQRALSISSYSLKAPLPLFPDPYGPSANFRKTAKYKKSIKLNVSICCKIICHFFIESKLWQCYLNSKSDLWNVVPGSRVSLPLSFSQFKATRSTIFLQSKGRTGHSH